MLNFQIAQQNHHQYQQPLYEYRHYNYNYNINQYNHSKNNFSNYKKPYCSSAYTDYPEKPIKMQREEIIIEHSQLVLNGNGATNENVGHHRSHHYTQVNSFLLLIGLRVEIQVGEFCVIRKTYKMLHKPFFVVKNGRNIVFMFVFRFSLFLPN